MKKIDPQIAEILDEIIRDAKLLKQYYKLDNQKDFKYLRMSMADRITARAHIISKDIEDERYED